jgi:hypothetical protein
MSVRPDGGVVHVHLGYSEGLRGASAAAIAVLALLLILFCRKPTC